MTEAEWLACDNPTQMVGYLRGNASDRKIRLLGSLCCRCHWHLLTDGRIRAAVEMAELWADGLATEAQLEAAESAADQAKDDIIMDRCEIDYSLKEFCINAARAVSLLAGISFDAERCVVVTGYCRVISFREGLGNDLAVSEDRSLCAIVRDIFGNPFRPIAFSPEWRTDTAIALARTMYESREFGAMPILADALQDAGCDNDDILSHCRGDGPHVRGCWVVDLVLGKT